MVMSSRHTFAINSTNSARFDSLVLCLIVWLHVLLHQWVERSVACGVIHFTNINAIFVSHRWLFAMRFSVMLTELRWAIFLPKKKRQPSRLDSYVDLCEVSGGERCDALHSVNHDWQVWQIGGVTFSSAWYCPWLNSVPASMSAPMICDEKKKEINRSNRSQFVTCLFWVSL